MGTLYFLKSFSAGYFYAYIYDILFWNSKSYFVYVFSFSDNAFIS